jgi:hypothetical protein
VPKQETDTKPTRTGVEILDCNNWGMWPHAFTFYAARYKVPSDFLITLLYLWDGTMGSGHRPSGSIGVLQIPVRERDARKWLTALVAVGFFEKETAGWKDKAGSKYTYVETTWRQWEIFFKWAGWVALWPGRDKVSTEQFANMARRALGLAVATDRKTPIPEPSPADRRAAIARAKARQK